MRLTDIKKIKTKGQARQFAIDWQDWQSKQKLSYFDMAAWEGAFLLLGRKFGLVREFRENGLI